MSEETAEYWKERYEAVIQMAQEDREELRGRIAELEGRLYFVGGSLNDIAMTGEVPTAVRYAVEPRCQEVPKSENP